MKIKRTAFILLLCLVIAVLPGCRNFGGFSIKNAELKIGVEGLGGYYNPFYAENEADLEVISQMFRPIQIRGKDNSLINHSGSISYEFVGDSQVKYTVSINNDMKFSDGTHITIDDVISYYHFISDASYDGMHKDWYLNDIVGLKEYYYDDENCEGSMREIENLIAEKYSSSTISVENYSDYLIKTKLEGKYGGIDSKAPSGVTWREYITSLGYSREIKKITASPTEEAWLKLAATAEAEKNPEAYNPENYYRELLYDNYMKKNYSDGADVTQISGIKKINDYTCSILFNSKNINAVSEINALIVPRSCYSTEYVKGSAQTVKEIEWFAVGSGPYIIAEKADDEVKMSYNEFYSDEECGFKNLKFIDLAAKGYDPIESVVSGKTDVVTTIADSAAVNALKDAPVQYSIDNTDYYVSMFFNTRTLDLDARKALMGLCSPNATLDASIGSYYTRLLNPLSVRFAEYPTDTKEPYYSDSTYSFYSKLNDSPVKNVTAYYCGNENDIEYSFLVYCKDVFSKNGVSLELIISDEATMKSAIESGKGDMWIERVYDGATCDKYDYFNSRGSKNKTGLSVGEIDKLTAEIRSATGFANKESLTQNLMLLIMQQAVEWPLYQLQTLTVYNTETVSVDSFAVNNESDGYAYFIPYLKPID